MPIDISEELNTIENNPGFFTVKNAVGSGAEKVSTTRDANITSELLTIRTGRYGIDIRMAIHDALAKLAQSGSTPWDGDIGSMALVGDPFIKDLTVIGYFRRLTPVQLEPFCAYSEFNGQATGCSIDERYNTATVIACVVHSGNVSVDEGFMLINTPENTKITKSGSPDTYQYINVYSAVVDYDDIPSTGYSIQVWYDNAKSDNLAVYMFVVNGERTVTLVSEGVMTTSNSYTPSSRQNFNQQLYLVSTMYHPSSPGVDITDDNFRNFISHEGSWASSSYDYQHNIAQDPPTFTSSNVIPGDYDAYLNYIHLEISRT